MKVRGVLLSGGVVSYLGGLICMIVYVYNGLWWCQYVAVGLALIGSLMLLAEHIVESRRRTSHERM